jgi:hypothetical protein
VLSPCLTPGCGQLVQGETRCPRHQQRAKAGAPGGPMLTPCIVPGCPNLVQGGGPCDRHAPRYGGKRQPGPNPWRDSGWPRIAAAYLAAHPRCEYDGCTELAVLVHHRDGSGRRGARANNDDSNLEALCSAHHGRRHHELHHAGVVELGPKRRGLEGSTSARQGSPVGPRKTVRNRSGSK